MEGPIIEEGKSIEFIIGDASFFGLILSGAIDDILVLVLHEVGAVDGESDTIYTSLHTIYELERIRRKVQLQIKR